MSATDHVQRLITASLNKGWNPGDRRFQFDNAAAAFRELKPEDRRWLSRLIRGFYAGEVSVAEELYCLQTALARLGWKDAVHYVSVQIVEELKHHEFFRLWCEAVGLDVASFSVGDGIDDADHILRRMEVNLRLLGTDSSPEALARAVASYHLVVEGVAGFTLIPVLAQVGKHVPGFAGLKKAAHYLHLDEARHVAFGVQLCNRLCTTYGNALKPVIDSELQSLARAVRRSVLVGYTSIVETDVSHFGVSAQYLLARADSHMKKRRAKLIK